MDWNPLLVTHVVAALYALVIGPVNIFRRRRDRTHRALGVVWAGAMYYVCVSSFWIVTDGHYSWLHGLSAFTILTVTVGILAAARGNVRAHRGNMIGSYLGLLAAFGFAATVPSRAIPRLLVTDPLTALLAATFVLGSVAVLYLTLKPRRRRRRPTLRFERASS
ncbi:DUF2306 domain-containing protein [Planctomonas psychrotolerans]|uniref:DUF2306 domain-containing protein n=1 Tax=Planctomonas psychrotolerans TaxID=2528712 RepID=UPI00123928A3|nr:DUF2306 domain-containing protein [Planctomonas psychrotolerans]